MAAFYSGLLIGRQGWAVMPNVLCCVLLQAVGECMSCAEGLQLRLSPSVKEDTGGVRPFNCLIESRLHASSQDMWGGEGRRRFMSLKWPLHNGTTMNVCNHSG